MGVCVRTCVCALVEPHLPACAEASDEMQLGRSRCCDFECFRMPRKRWAYHGCLQVFANESIKNSSPLHRTSAMTLYNIGTLPVIGLPTTEPPPQIGATKHLTLGTPKRTTKITGNAKYHP